MSAQAARYSPYTYPLKIVVDAGDQLDDDSQLAGSTTTSITTCCATTLFLAGLTISATGSITDHEFVSGFGLGICTTISIAALSALSYYCICKDNRAYQLDEV